MSSAEREDGLPEISLNLCLEASLSSYVYHEPTAFSQTVYIFQALQYSYRTDTNQTFRNKNSLTHIFEYLGMHQTERSGGKGRRNMFW